MSVNVLETLYAARTSLADERNPFEFMDYTSCTCGHIYNAAAGGFAPASYYVSAAKNPVYADAIVGVAKALGWDPTGPEADVLGAAIAATQYVSMATSRVIPSSERSEPPLRRHALAVIDEAIEKVEAEQERNRLAVLEQARAVVDAAVPDPAPALA